jgi:O-antigen ligase
MAVVLLLGLLSSKRFGLSGKWIRGLMFAVLFFFVVLSLLISSRAGILAVLVILMFSAYYLFKTWKIRVISILFLILAGYYIARNYRFDEVFLIIKKTVNAPQSVDQNFLVKSTVNRLVFWKASSKVIRENFWFGVGNGDVNASMREKYREMGIDEGIKKKSDPHNQFLRTFMATGLPGFLALIGIFIYSIIKGVRKRNFYLLAFVILIVIHFMAETMLFRIDGVVFFSYFYALFNQPSQNNIPSG